MKYRVNPRNGDQLSVLGYGCMRFTNGHGIGSSFMGKIDLEKTEKLIMTAIDQGVNYFDTAYIYAGSEEALGTILERNQVREKVYIATKMPLIHCHKAEDLDKYFNVHLERLKTDYIDYYLMHMLPDLNMWKTLKSWGIEEWIKQKKASGVIRNIGFSFHGTQKEFLDLLDAYDWDFVQIQYNYSDPNYQAGITGLKAAHEKELPVFIMEPLLGGKLANNLPTEAKKRFESENAERSIASWGFRWLYNQPEVTVVLSGMNESEQLTDNIQTANEAEVGMLSEADVKAIEDVRIIFNEAYKVHCTGCHYCMPCPFGVNIPACFTAYNTASAINRSQGFQQYMMSTIFAQKQGYAGLCKKCGKCETHCPQHLPIRQHLEETAKEFEGPFFKIAKVIVPWYTKKKANTQNNV